MASYNVLINAVIKRELGILGKERMAAVLNELKIETDAESNLLAAESTIDDLDRLMHSLSGRYGAVAVMGCKIAVGRLARENGLPLPAILS